MSVLDELNKHLEKEPVSLCLDEMNAEAIKSLCGKIDELRKDHDALVDIVNSHGQSLDAQRQETVDLQSTCGGLARVMRDDAKDILTLVNKIHTIAERVTKLDELKEVVDQQVINIEKIVIVSNLTTEALTLLTEHARRPT